MDYDERVLPSIGNEVLKSIVAQFDAAELITQREVVCDPYSRHSLNPHTNVIRYHPEYVKIFSSEPGNSTLNWKMSLLHT